MTHHSPPETTSVIIRVNELEVGDVFLLFGHKYEAYKIDHEKIFYKIHLAVSGIYTQTFFKNSNQKIELIWRKKKAEIPPQ
jgi:hypothetical protein